MQNLQFFGSLYDLHSSKINERLKYLINSFELFPYININFQKLPTGIKQRLAIVRALLHNPSILLLDEPTRSLDFKFVDTFYKFLKEELVEKEGKTIVLVSHNKSEIEKLATNSIVLNNGIIK